MAAPTDRWKWDAETGEVVALDVSDTRGGEVIPVDFTDEPCGLLAAAAPDMARALLDDVVGIVETVPEGQWSPETARKVAALRKGGVL